MAAAIRHDWQHDELQALFDLPFPELLFRAAAVHREHFDRRRCRCPPCCR